MQKSANKTLAMFLAILFMFSTVFNLAASAKDFDGEVVMTMTTENSVVRKGDTVSFLVNISKFTKPNSMPVGSGIGRFDLSFRWDTNVLEYVSLVPASTIPESHLAKGTEPGTAAGNANISRGRAYLSWAESTISVGDYSRNIFEGADLGIITFKVKADTTATSTTVTLQNSDEYTNFSPSNSDIIYMKAHCIGGGCDIQITDAYDIKETYVEKANRTNELATAKTTTVNAGSSYTGTPANVAKWVCTGYYLDGVSVVDWQKNDYITNGNVVTKPVTCPISAVSRNHDIQYIYMADNNENGIPDEYEDVVVTETYVEKGNTTNKLATDKVVAAIIGQNYTSTPANVVNWVCTGYYLDGVPVVDQQKNEYNQNGNMVPKPVTGEIAKVSDNHALQYIYMADNNNNGIPDEYEDVVVTETYVEKGNTVNKLATDKVVAAIIGQNYKSTPVAITGWVCTGYSVDGVEKLNYEQADFANGPQAVTGAINPVSSNHALQYFYMKDDNGNEIPDLYEELTLTELFVDEDTKEVLDTEVKTITGYNTTYSYTPPKNITKEDKLYVAVGYIQDGQTHTTYDYTNMKYVAFTVSQVMTQDTTLTYLYRETKDGDTPIPREYTITEEYQDEDATTLQPNTLSTVALRDSYSKDAPVINGYAIIGYKVDGVVEFMFKESQIKEAFEKGETLSLTAKIANVSENHTVTFIYAKASVNPPIPDKYLTEIIEQYYDAYGNQIQADKKTVVWRGDNNYTSAAPAINLYTVRGYTIDGGAEVAGSSYNFVNVNVPQTTIRYIYDVNHLTSGIYEMWYMYMEDARCLYDDVVDQYNVSKIGPGVSVQVFLNNFNQVAGKITVYHANGTPLTQQEIASETVKTGMYIKHTITDANGVERTIREWHAVIFGDVDGDGWTTTRDYNDTVLATSGNHFLTGSQYLAAKITKSNVILDSNDYGELQDYINRLIIPNQSLVGTQWESAIIN